MDHDVAFLEFARAAADQIRQQTEIGDLRKRIIGMLHPGQRRIYRDASRFKAVVTSRRFGKSIVAAAMIVEAAMERPGNAFDPEILYIADTAENARALLAKNLLELKRHIPELTWEERPKNSRLYFVFPNGCTVWAAGVPDRIQVKVFRGFDYRLAVVDEAQNVPERILRPLLGESIMPALTRTRGRCVLIGTPGQHLSGLFYEATATEEDIEKTGAAKGWAGFVGKMWENPFLFAREGEDPKKLKLSEIKARFERLAEEQRVVNGWGPEEPAFLREYHGLWRTDAGLVAFPYTPDANFCETAPQGEMRTILGADIGTRGVSAFVVVGVIPGKLEKYILHTEQHTGVESTHQFCSLAKAVYQKFRCHRAIVDAGGLGGGYVKDMRDLYGLRVEEAKKSDKVGHVRSFRGELARGTIKLVDPPRHRALLAEWDVLKFASDGGLWDEDDPDHLSDAAMYAWRHIRAWNRKEAPEPPSPGTPGWHEMEAQKLREQRCRRAAKRVRARGWKLP